MQKTGRLDEQSPIFLYELLRKRISFYADQYKKRISEAQRDDRKIVMLSNVHEESLDRYMLQLKEKTQAMGVELNNLKEKVSALEGGIKYEQAGRQRNIRESKECMEKMKEEYKELLKKLEDREIEMLKLKQDKSAAEEYEMYFKIKAKEVEKLEQQNLILKNKMEQKQFLIQAQYLKVIHEDDG
eukprot:TRINITY_DN2908_c0_g5_i1.p1 TRINITY_DN2908_c0_g5~~TRINITY_DN2908_c0_g5_i1.p1  ORF type:complete len:185 (+),score=76.31 TRINITY_DN2908_c0_g5_i1:378-932(+)